MQTDLIQQWTSSAKEINEFNLSVMNAVTENMENIWGPKPLAKIGKTLIDSGNEQKKMQNTTLNRTLRRQVGAMNLNNVAASVENFSAAATDTMTRLVNSQVSIINLYTETSKNYLKELSRSGTMFEAFTASVTMFSELQKDLPSKAMEPALVLNGFQDAMGDWASKTVDSLAADKPAPKKKG